MTKPEIACEFKIRKVHEYSAHPTSYEVLLYRKGDRGWHTLRMSDGSRALFTRPPENEAEARRVIKEWETQRHVLEAA